MEDTSGNSQQQERRENALQHGLTAVRLLPRVLRPGRLEELKTKFRQEYSPATVTGEVYVAEAARHAAMLEIIEEAEPAVMVQAAGVMTSLSDTATVVADPGLQLAAAVSAEPLERVSRYRRAHERALHQALEKLAAGRLPASPNKADEKFREQEFDTEEKCVEYLLQRYSSPSWRCPRCRQRDGHVLAARRLWECSSCHFQTGIRHGTVLEKSPLPLPLWFSAIRHFAAKTTISPAELALVVGIRRQATAREMVRRMRAALHGDDVCGRFAGLGTFLPPTHF